MLGRLFRKKERIPALYAEINSCLRELGSNLEVDGRVVRHGNRSCQVFGRYIDFWENGMKWLGVDCVADVAEMARLLYFWLDLRLNSDEIERLVPGIAFPEGRKRIEQGEESFLDWYWQHLVAKGDRRFGRLIELFARNPRTRRLMSFTRWRDFGFSRIIPPHEHLSDLPFVRITDQFEFEVHCHLGLLDAETGHRKCLGKGDAQKALELILAYLPANVGVSKYCDLESDAPAA